jgi:hypothetical protein
LADRHSAEAASDYETAEMIISRSPTRPQCRYTAMVIGVMDIRMMTPTPDHDAVDVRHHLRPGLDMFSGMPLPCPIDRHPPVSGGQERTVHTDAHVHFRGFNLVGSSVIMIPLSPTSDRLATLTP